VPAGASAAVPIAVTTTDDAANPAGCSLREAVESANTDTAVGGCTAGDGVDTITLGQGNYALTYDGPNNDDLNASGAGDLDVGGDGVLIEGVDDTQTSVDGIFADRVFDFHAGTSELRDLTVTNGQTPNGDPGPGTTMVGNDSVGDSGSSVAGGGVDDGDGGGIRNAASLTLTRVTVVNNHTGAGGAGTAAGTGGDNGGGGGGAAVGGSGGSGGNGGGIANDADGELTVNDSVVSNNVAGNGGTAGAGGEGGGGVVGGTSQGGSGGSGGNGGGIYQEGGSAALTISRSTVTGNGAGGGGNGGDGGTAGTGLDSDGASTSGQGGMGGEGGGVYVGGGSAMDVSDTAIDGNSAGYGGDGGQGGKGGDPLTGGLSSGGRGGNGGNGGGLKTFADTNTIAGSAVVRNSSGYGGDGGDAGTGDTRIGGDGGDAGNGGGVDLAGPTQVFSNSTVAANSANGGGNAGAAAAGTGATQGTDGVGGSGGGIVIESSAPDVHLTHLTIASNSQGAGSAAGDGGGLFHEVAPNPPVLENTIVANNNGVECGGTNTDGGHNISFPLGHDCAATIHSDPLLGALAPHGGLTPTMQLLAGSPAIDAAGTGSPCTATDQRGVTRPKGTACDIGAVERSLPTATTGGANSIQPKQATVAGTVNPGQLLTSYFFRFGRTTAYGSRSPTAFAGSGGVNVVALATLRGLTPNAVYHYRLIVTNFDGTATGIDRTFHTKPLNFPGVEILTGEVTVRNGFARIKVSCPDRTAVIEHCNGTLVLSKHVKKTTVGFGKRKFSIRPGKSAVVKVPVSKAGRELLAKQGKVTVKALARAGDARRGAPKFATRKVTLKTP
jgi:CSLREA domain-containing protein